MNRHQLWETLLEAAQTIYDPQEARAVTRLLCQSLFGLHHGEVIVDPEGKIGDDFSPEYLDEVLFQLKSARPVQYIIGNTEFCGLKLQVSEGVLIPRPETEELVDWILSEHLPELHNAPFRLLDIGTGSGAIALGVASKIKPCQAIGIDISSQALTIAIQNAQQHHLQVEFLRCDILQQTPPFTRLDVVVSNPPYIPESEKKEMASHVLDFEPHEALFVPDNDPLLFYRTIAQKAPGLLKKGGRLYFEINEIFGKQICSLLSAQGYVNVELREDIFGRPRMVRALTPL